MTLKNKKGFTLIELMVVMAIIAVLAVLMIGAIQLARRTATETTHRSNAKTVQTGIEGYFAKKKSYPATSGTVSLDAANTSLGTSGVTLGLTPECAGTAQLGGGTVTWSTTGYTIMPYDYKCTAALDASDQISNN